MADLADAGGSDDALRAKLGTLLRTVKTEWQERASTSEAVGSIVARLRAVAAGDDATKLIVAGFTPTPFSTDSDDIAQACETCMYFAQHRQFCDLPELRLPVRPEWSCRLWRI